VSYSGRLVAAFSHQHGGRKHHLLESATCGRRIVDASVYHGLPSHPYRVF
jgi:hypothetical protein